MNRTINFCEFCDDFKARRPENFTYDGLKALFNYLKNFEEDTGQEIEFDVIGLCCDFTEYENLAEFQSDYDDDYETIEDIENETTVIRIDDESFIIQQF